MRGRLLLAAAMAATSLSMAQPAAARDRSYHDAHVASQQQCTADRQNRTIGGAVIGGLLGAVVGSQVSGRGHRTDGSVLGAVVGATAGGAIGRNQANQRCDVNRPDQRAYDPYYGRPYSEQGYYGQDGQRGYEDELEGGPYRESSYNGRRGDDRNCRWGEQVMRDPDGYEVREQVYMCRGRDGVWRAEG